MSENPQPDPEKAKADAAPKTSSSFSGPGGPRASAYVPLPGAKPRPRLGLALAALAAAGALAGGVVWFRAPSAPSPVPIVAENRKVLWVAEADVNAAATERLRASAPPAAAVPDSDRAPAAGSMGSGDPEAPRGPPTAAVQIAAPAPPPAVESRAASPLPVVPPELMNAPASAPQSALTPQGIAAVRADGFTVFQMRMLDNVDQDGDVVQVSVDGVPMSFLSLTHAGATLEIPLKKGESHTITITAVKDGVGGITLGMSTSVGDLTSRRLAVGESETWTIGFK